MDKFSRSENFYDNDYLEDKANLWTPEKGFQSQNLRFHQHGYPKPGVGSGNLLGLSLILNAAINEYYCSTTSSIGFKVVLHSPNELPEVSYYGLPTASGHESRIVATPVLSKASKAVRRMPMDIRQCIFENENFLSYYR